MSIPITLAAVDIKSIRRSVGIPSDSELGKLLGIVTQQIKEIFPDFEDPFKITQNSVPYKHHVELIDDENDIANKSENYKSLNGLEIDLYKSENWSKEGRAIVLNIGKFPGHVKPLHITVGFNKNGFTDEVLDQIKVLILEIVEQHNLSNSKL